MLAARQFVDEKVALEIFEKLQVMLTDAYEKLDVTEQPGTTEVFIALKSRDIGVVLNTGYNAATAKNLIDKIGWKQGVHFDCLITASDVDKNRPDPDMIFLAMEKLGISDAGSVVKVGDSAIDIEEGQNAGCRLSIGITTEAHTEQQLRQANPDYIIQELAELITIIERLPHQHLV